MWVQESILAEKITLCQEDARTQRKNSQTATSYE